MNKGVVFGNNANHLYITSGLSGSMFKMMMENAKVPTQESLIKQDTPCGMSLGPMLSSHLGCKGVDMGVPQLAMHSIREVMGVVDAHHFTKMFDAFYENDLPELK